MHSEIDYSPLTVTDVEEVATVLLCDKVFKFIGEMPSREEFKFGLSRALAGPPKTRVNEHWVNYGVRLRHAGNLIGRVEATVHDDLAEVAFLYSPTVWGRGFATGGLLWLHNHLRSYKTGLGLWATVHPENTRSSALLLKNGYQQAAPDDLPLLYSYEKGDLVFHRSVA